VAQQLIGLGVGIIYALTSLSWSNIGSREYGVERRIFGLVAPEVNKTAAFSGSQVASSNPGVSELI